MNKSNFFYLTRQKGQIFNGYKITNNSNYILFYRENESTKAILIGEFKTKSDTLKYIDKIAEIEGGAET